MNRRTLIAVLLVLATSISMGSEPPWRWFWQLRQDGEQQVEPDADQDVTNNAGANSVLTRSYDDGKIWTTTGFSEEDVNNLQKGFEYDDFGQLLGVVTIADEEDLDAGNVCLASTNDNRNPGHFPYF